MIGGQIYQKTVGGATCLIKEFIGLIWEVWGIYWNSGLRNAECGMRNVIMLRRWFENIQGTNFVSSHTSHNKLKLHSVLTAQKCYSIGLKCGTANWRCQWRIFSPVGPRSKSETL